MNLDKFGRQQSGSGKRQRRGPAGIGFTLTNQGDFNIQNKRLCNLAEPIDDSDSSTKKYCDFNISQNKNFLKAQLASEIESFTKRSLEYFDKKLNDDLASYNKTVTTNLERVFREFKAKQRKALEVSVDKKLALLKNSLTQHDIPQVFDNKLIIFKAQILKEYSDTLDSKLQKFDQVISKKFALQFSSATQ